MVNACPVDGACHVNLGSLQGAGQEIVTSRRRQEKKLFYKKKFVFRE
jgi:hypothetical protein